MLRIMLPLFGPGDIVAMDRNDKEIRKKMIYAVKVKITPNTMGSTIKFVEKISERTIILRPKNEDFPVEVIDLTDNPDPIIGRIIWCWRLFK